MDADTASFGTARALNFQGRLRTDLFGEVDHSTGHKRHFLLSRAADDLSLPVQNKGLFMELLPFAHWPGFAVNRKLVAAFARPVGYSNRPDRCAVPAKRPL